MLGDTIFTYMRGQTLRRKCTVLVTALYELGFAVAHALDWRRLNCRKCTTTCWNCLSIWDWSWHVPLKHDEIFQATGFQLSVYKEVGTEAGFEKRWFLSFCDLYIYRAYMPSWQCGDARIAPGRRTFQTVHTNLGQKINSKKLCDPESQVRS